MTKDTSDHGHGDRSLVVLVEQSADHDVRNLGQFPARAVQDFPAEFILTRDDRAKQGCEIRRRD